MDYLEKEYGIKEDERYYIVHFQLQDIRDIIHVKGEILNFHSTQLILKSDKGLYIISPKNIVEMRPIKQMKSR